VDLADASLGLGRALEGQARRAKAASEGIIGWREAACVYDEGLQVAVSLAAENHVVGRSARLLADLREGRARCEKALGPAGTAQLTPGRSGP